MNDPATDSYRDCCQLARATAGNFYYSFWVLPAEKRRAQCALYAFFRRTDDLGDTQAPIEERRRLLADWRSAWDRAQHDDYSDPLLPAIVDTVRRYAIPPEYLTTAIDGVASDLDRTRFATFDELQGYCYQVAGVVGLASIHVWGFRHDPEAIEAARSCGTAFQLTNILRDVAEDFRLGRIYLPQDELSRFGIAEEQIASGVVDQGWREFIRFQVDRAETCYAQARRLHRWLDPDGQKIFGAMTDIYYALLQKIRGRDGDLFGPRIRLRAWHKALLALKHLRPRLGPLFKGESPQAVELRGGAR